MIKRSISLTIILTLVMASFGNYKNVEAKTGGQLLTGILSKMQAAHRGLRSMRTSITQQRHNPQIGGTDTDYGTLIYKPGGKGNSRLRIDYTKPDQKSVSVIGESLVFYQPRINQVFKSTLSKAAKGKTGSYAGLIGLDSSLESLTKEYNVEYVKDVLVNGKETSLLSLTPKGGSPFSKVELWVSSEFWLPVQYKMYEHNGDSTLVKFTGMEVNPSINETAFKISYPSSAKLVDKL